MTLTADHTVEHKGAATWKFSRFSLLVATAFSTSLVLFQLASSAAKAQVLVDSDADGEQPMSEGEEDEDVKTEVDSDNPNVVVRSQEVDLVQQLAFVTAEEEKEEERLALAREAEEAEEAERERLLLARAGTIQISNRDPQEKAPWLARSLNPSEPDSAADNEISLNLSAVEGTRSQKPETPWLARTSATEEEEEGSAANLLARSRIAAEDEENESDENLVTALPQRNTAKRSANWVSIFHEELGAPQPGALPSATTKIAADPAVSSDADPSADPDAVAIRSTDSGVTVYDISDLPQGSITPTRLAGGTSESEVVVNASQVDFLSPAPNAFLNTPATSVVLQFPVGAKIALLVNGRTVDPSQIGRTETDTETQLRIQTWYGVTLSSGDNTLEIVSTETGQVLKNMTVTVRGMPAELALLSPRAIPADGRSTSQIRGQLLDESGNISRWESLVTLEASDGQFLGTDANPDAPGFQVRAQAGEFSAELQSSLESHLVQLRGRAGGFEAFSQIQFVTPQRSSLISGVVDLRFGAQGTDYYGSYRDFLPLDGDNNYGLDVDAAVFATGNIGEWLYTGAYNSDRTLNQDCNGDTRLFRANSSSCESTYATYGDDSYSDVITPSLDSVFLRFERTSPSAAAGTDYVMWGDYNTEEFSATSQLFTATNRRLHGFKANYNFGNLALTGLYANNVEGFQRDTIAPDGTSGFYFTSQRNLVPGSERVYLELEELERPGTVLERVSLTRGADYDIDYDRGTLLFNDPSCSYSGR